MNALDGTKLKKSFGYAIKGIITLLETEQNARIHLYSTIFIGIASIAFRLSHTEAAIIFMAVIMVFALEITNTAIEKMLDLLHPESHIVVEKVKDAMAGAVLISSTIAAVVAVLIFYPHVRDLILSIINPQY